ncbi:hypothetical protein BC827DRAFT_1235727 [Russula dissimulans]|nr:hypothetical protein BC827DRAFT_1235727 [Russula dissimulans]
MSSEFTFCDPNWLAYHACSIRRAVGRPSAFSFGIITAVLLSSFLPAVRADCKASASFAHLRDGNTCDGIDPVPIGVGIAISNNSSFLYLLIRALLTRPFGLLSRHRPSFRSHHHQSALLSQVACRQDDQCQRRTGKFLDCLLSHALLRLFLGLKWGFMLSRRTR